MLLTLLKINPFENYQIIRKELINYGAEIENKKEIIALNKTGIMNEKEVEQNSTRI